MMSEGPREGKNVADAKHVKQSSEGIPKNVDENEARRIRNNSEELRSEDIPPGFSAPRQKARPRGRSKQRNRSERLDSDDVDERRARSRSALSQHSNKRSTSELTLPKRYRLTIR